MIRYDLYKTRSCLGNIEAASLMLSNRLLRPLSQLCHPGARRLSSTAMSSSIPHDIRLFLTDYPDNHDDKTQSANLDFYSNKQRSQPDNVLINEIHER